jgi:hypothetical protein
MVITEMRVGPSQVVLRLWLGSDPDQRTFDTQFPKGGPAGRPKFICLLVGI